MSSQKVSLQSRHKDDNDKKWQEMIGDKLNLDGELEDGYVEFEGVI